MRERPGSDVGVGCRVGDLIYITDRPAAAAGGFVWLLIDCK
jgi:hypothetical protein